MPDPHARRDRRSTRAGLREAALDRLIEPLLTDAGGAGPAFVVDLGGGAGTLSVRLAEHGHDVVVVDPSPDALAALDRRAREAGVAERVRGHQGDARQLAGLLDRPVDVLLCHDVLELVDDPAATLLDVAAVLRPGGVLSLLTAQRSGAAALRAAAGRVEEALAVLSHPDGCTGADDPLLRRLDAATTAELLAAAGLDVVAVVGVPVLADLVPEAVLDAGPRVREALRQLEAAAGEHPDLRGLASHLHWHAVRRAPAG
ncbi:class I SAM-dependent methyltransferase [Aquipuribacter nitratireducens]|uniref:Class I SAM-dependent methyltransferase n=1 Tax=Aquipuribacter nitratireducens TaxID=650104 RepID=A0ABW0GQG7_9MICO